MDEKLIETFVSGETVFDGKLLHVHRDVVALPDGKTANREYIRHQGAAAVVPLTAEGDVIAVRQYRYPLGRVTLEIPAGKRDPGEDPAVTAARELSEETGCEPGELIELGTLCPSVAYTDEVIWMYLAEGLHFGESHVDDDEFVDVVRIPLDDFVAMVMDGTIADSKTQAAILKTKFLLENREKGEA